MFGIAGTAELSTFCPGTGTWNRLQDGTIQNTIVVVLGIIFSYFLDGGINKAYLVFPGMSLAALAIGLGVLAHCTSPAIQERRREKSNARQTLSTKDISMTSFSEEQAYDLESQDEDSLAISSETTEEAQVSYLSSTLSASAVSLPSLPLKKAPPVPRGQLPRTDLSRQSTASSMRSVQKADSSIYLGLAIAVAGEQGWLHMLHILVAPTLE